MACADSNRLCLECGLCCNGVIFAKGQLEPGDDAQQLENLGLKLVAKRNPQSVTQKFHQPCAAFDAGKCNIYADRPAYCRQFECALLKQVRAGSLDEFSALQTITRARTRADAVRQLLRDLGNTDEHLALNLRFRRVTRRMESFAPDEGSLDNFGKLTLAVHDLNVLLSESFYPGP
jgi:Fe-S-cluster containining protein